MNTKIVKAQAKLERSLNSLDVTPDGQLWLQHALDPFKDLPTPCRGFPDTDSGASVVQVVKMSNQVYSTFGTNTWDCNIFLDTVATSIPLVTVPVIQYGYATSVGIINTPYNQGGVVIRAAPSGTPLELEKTTGNMPLPDSYYDETETRIIAMGLEVHNTTAELTKQGAVAYWRVPAESDVPSVISLMDNFGASASIPVAYPLNTMQEPPNTLAQAVLLPGTIQMEAKEGAYITGVMSQESNPARERAPSYFYRRSNGKNYGLNILKVGTVPVCYTNCAAQEIPFCLSGAFFTGLSPTTTLTVNVTYMVERFVKNTASNDLITLASPSAPFDANAMRIYSEVAKTLATGVPVSENGLGDWVSGIASTIARYAGPVLSGIGNAINQVNDQDHPRSSPAVILEQPKTIVVQDNKNKNKDNKKIASLEKQIAELTAALTKRPTPTPVRVVTQPARQQARVVQPQRAVQQRNHTDATNRFNPNSTQTWRQPNEYVRRRVARYH